jgi:hypothetical protein
MYHPTYVPLDLLSIAKRNFKRHLNIIGIILIITVSRTLIHFIIRLYQIVSTKSFDQPTSPEFTSINNIYFFIFYARYFINTALFILFYVLASDFNKLEEALPELEFKPNKITISLIFAATFEFITMLFSILRMGLVSDILICITPVPFMFAFWFMKDLFAEMEEKQIIDNRADRFLLYSQIYILFINILQNSLDNTIFSNWSFNTSQFTYYILRYVTVFIYYGLFLLGIYRTTNDFKEIKTGKQKSFSQVLHPQQDTLKEDTNFKFCINCGSKHRDSVKFCSNCGKKMK